MREDQERIKELETALASSARTQVNYCMVCNNALPNQSLNGLSQHEDIHSHAASLMIDCNQVIASPREHSSGTPPFTPMSCIVEQELC